MDYPSIRVSVKGIDERQRYIFGASFTKFYDYPPKSYDDRQDLSLGSRRVFINTVKRIHRNYEIEIISDVQNFKICGGGGEFPGPGAVGGPVR